MYIYTYTCEHWKATWEANYTRWESMLSRIKKISLNWSSLLHWPRGFYHPANVFHSSMNPRLAFIYSYIYTWIHIFFLKINISKVSQKISLKDLFTCYIYITYTLSFQFPTSIYIQFIKKKKKRYINCLMQII